MRDPREFSFVRSRVTWFGITGLVFLLWAWADSMGNSTLVGVGRTGCMVGQGAGAIGFQRFTAWSGRWEIHRTAYSSIPLVERRDLTAFPDFEARWRDKGLLRLVIPHWALVTVYVFLWGAGLFWRWRIHRRAMRLPYEAEAP